MVCGNTTVSLIIMRQWWAELQHAGSGRKTRRSPALGVIDSTSFKRRLDELWMFYSIRWISLGHISASRPGPTSPSMQLALTSFPLSFTSLLLPLITHTIIIFHTLRSRFSSPRVLIFVPLSLFLAFFQECSEEFPLPNSRWAPVSLVGYK